MKKWIVSFLFLSACAQADTPGQIINKTCAASQWFSAITKTAPPVCSQPAYTDISGLVAQLAGKAPTGSYISALTGDMIATGPGIATATLGSSGVTPGDYTNASISVDAKGRVTSAANGSSSSGVTSVTGTAPIVSTGGTTPVISVTTATANTSGAIVRRDGSGNFSAGTITAALSGNASTATALAANPADCSAGQFANAIAANGDLTCATPAGSSGVTAVTATSPLASSGGTTPDLTIQNADASHTGALTSTDWSTFNGKQASGNYITALTSDVSASGPGSAAATVNSVGGSSAANVHAAELLANAAVSTNTSSTIVKRDGSGNFSAGTISAALSGNSTTATSLAANPTDCSGSNYAISIDASGNLTCSQVTDAQLSTSDITTNDVSTSKHGFTPKLPNDSAKFLNGVGAYAVPAGTGITALTGDVTASGSGSVAATVALVGGSTAANVHAAELLANAATNLNTASAIVKRDGSGNFSAGTISAALTGNSTTSTALAANPTDCSSNTYANAIDASGNLSCVSAVNSVGPIDSVSPASNGLTISANLIYPQTATTTAPGLWPLPTVSPKTVSGGVIVVAPTPGMISLVVKGAVSQSASIFEVQNSNGSTLFSVTNAGNASASAVVQGTKFVATGGLSTFVPAAGGAIQINAPAAFAGPVFEVKSNGSQVAYVSDLGNALFQNISNLAGIATNTINPYSGSDTSVNGNFIPGADNNYKLGDGGHHWSEIHGTTLYGTSQVSSPIGSFSDYIEVINQGSSYLKWGANSHTVRWKMGSDAGSDQDWTWPGDKPASGNKVFQIDSSGTITFVDAPAATLSAVLSAGNDGGNQDIANVHNIHAHAVIPNPTNTPLALGDATNENVQFVAGDDGSSPSNPVTPAKWIKVYDSSGTVNYLPLYQ